MTFPVEFPLTYVPTFTAGRPVANGFVYVGKPDTDPTTEANQIQLYVVQEDGTRIPVDQPQRLSAGGVPIYNGSDVQLSVDESPYALTIQGSNQQQEYYFPITDGISVLSPTVITKVKPSTTNGQTVINVSAMPDSLNVYKNNTILQETDGDYTYNKATGDITLAVALTGSDVIEIQYGDIISQTARNISGSYQVNTVQNMIDNADWQVGDVVETLGYHFIGDSGAAKYIVVATGTADGGEFIALTASGLLAQCTNLVEDGFLAWEKYGASTLTSIDSADAIRRAENYIFNNAVLPNSITMGAGASGGTYLLKSFVTGTGDAAGDTFAILIRDGEKCKIVGNEARLLIDINTATMAARTAVIGFYENGIDQAFLKVKDLRVDGGQWPLTSQYPTYSIRADYNVMKYSWMENVRCFRASEDNIKTSGFVLDFWKCDCRFATNGRNFNTVVTTVDGDGATRTGVMYMSCTADQAGLHGYAITGGNGTTYSAIFKCTADNIGRDESGNTIIANIATAAAYRFSAVFGCEMSSCGSERSTRAIRATGVRAFHINTFYDVNMGSTDAGNPVSHDIEIDGFSEEVKITGYRNSTRLNASMKTLQITTPSGFNTTQVTTDIGIPTTQVDVTVTDADSSAPFTLARFDDFWARGRRNPGGDGLIMGDPDPGRQSSDNFDQNDYVAEKNFKFTTGSTVPQTFDILTLTNPANAGHGSCYLEVMVARSNGTIPTSPTRWKMSASTDSNNKIVGPVEAEYNDILTDPALSWSSDTLQLTMNNTFSAVFVKAVYAGRASTGFQTMNWAATNG